MPQTESNYLNGEIPLGRSEDNLKKNVISFIYFGNLGEATYYMICRGGKVAL